MLVSLGTIHFKKVLSEPTLIEKRSTPFAPFIQGGGIEEDAIRKVWQYGYTSKQTEDMGFQVSAVLWQMKSCLCRYGAVLDKVGNSCRAMGYLICRQSSSGRWVAWVRLLLICNACSHMLRSNERRWSDMNNPVPSS